MAQQDIINRLQKLYQEIDQKSGQIAAVYGTKLTCHHGCSDCCLDELTVFQVEAENISRQAGSLLKESVPAKIGRCAFLTPAGGCKIYSYRPYVCRTQGLPLRWLVQSDDDTWVEYRDICPLNQAVEPIENLRADDCWEIGPYEKKLAQLQADSEKGKMLRVSLRSLFQIGN